MIHTVVAETVIAQHDEPCRATWSARITATWLSFVREVEADGRLWLLGIALLQLFRVILIVLFRHRLSLETGAADVLQAMVVGLQFDLPVAAWFALPSFVLSAGGLLGIPDRFAQRVRQIGLLALIVSWTVVGAIAVGFFHEYSDNFNHQILGAFDNDFLSILTTVWKQRPVVWVLLGVVVAFVVLKRIGGSWCRRQWLTDQRAGLLTRTWLRRIVVLGLVLFAVRCGLRGTIRWRHGPAELSTAAVSRDRVLNSMVLNPFWGIRATVSKHLLLKSAKGLNAFLPDRDVRKAAHVVSEHTAPLATVDDALRRVAKGPKGIRPQHVFFIQMESYDAWPTLDRYQSLKLCDRLMDLGRRGIMTRKFLSASDSTSRAFNLFVSGIPDVGIQANHRPALRQPLPSSMNPIVQRLGFRTRMFLGGFSTWQRCAEFCLEQGFQEFYGAPDMTRWLKANEWGPDDRELFEFALRAIDPKVPSFNFIMTSSYHPPHSVDVYANGFPLHEVPSDLKAIFTADQDYLRVLGHLWYSDQMLGEFVAAAEQKFPNSLFVITGDHQSRRFLNDHPTLYERLAVPFVMYGPDVLKDVAVPEDLAGSHFDILPTLFEMLAPKGFVYHAVGRDLLDASLPQIGFGRDEIIGRNFVASRLPGGPIEAIPGTPLPENLPDLPRLQQEYQALLGLAWWRICRGSEFPNPAPTSSDQPKIDVAREPSSTSGPR
ncbi:MAG: LTA synthase family protein [Planctomycetaceae bacterium]